MSVLIGTAVAGECVVLAHGGGGELTQRLVHERLCRPLSNAHLAPLTDGAVLPWKGDRLVMTTDSYVVTPLEFPGGDIGKLAVCGTINDLAVMGARPVALSLGLILEEGLSLTTLDRIVASIAEVSRQVGVPIVTGDTKVIERRSAARDEGDFGHEPAGPGLFINTTGVGRLRVGVELGVERCRPGDCVIVNGPIAEHGLTVLAQRDGVAFDSPLQSDAAPLYELIADVLNMGADVKFLRDATRGGVAGVLADIRDGARASIEIDEKSVPLSPAARHAAEFFGLDPLTVANEGKVVAVVAANACDAVLSHMRQNRLGRQAVRIGRLTDAVPPLVELRTRLGGRRLIERPYGEDLPRIC